MSAPVRGPRAGAVAVALALVVTVLHAEEASRPRLLEPRVVDASISGVSFDRADIALRVAVRAGRDLTIRSISALDAHVGSVPVWVAPVEGNWPLRAGDDIEIPRPLIVTVRALDAAGAEGFRDLVRDGALVVRATVEIRFATPFLARLLMQPATQAAVSPVTLRVPIGSAPQRLQSVAELGAAVIDGLQRSAAPLLVAGRNGLPGNRAVAERAAPLIAQITTHYAIDDGLTPVQRSVTSIGFWWTRGVFCTTREALEPWQFDSTDAILLQAGGGRLRPERSARIESGPRTPAVDIDLASLGERLGPVQERRVFALAPDGPRRIRLSDRDATSSIACVRVDDDPSGPAAAVAFDGVPAAAAAFTVASSRGPVWTDIGRGKDGELILKSPMYRSSFGSPLMTADGLVGIVVSPTRGWDVQMLAAAAARAPRLGLRQSGNSLR